MGSGFRSLSGDAFSHWMNDASRQEDKRIAFFIGAGCSASSGISTAGVLVQDNWLPRLRDRHAPMRDDISEWAKEFLPEYDPANPSAAYGSIIEKLFYWP